MHQCPIRKTPYSRSHTARDAATILSKVQPFRDFCARACVFFSTELRYVRKRTAVHIGVGLSNYTVRRLNNARVCVRKLGIAEGARGSCELQRAKARSVITVVSSCVSFLRSFFRLSIFFSPYLLPNYYSLSLGLVPAGMLHRRANRERITDRYCTAAAAARTTIFM